MNTEENAKSLIDEHLRALNWNLADFTQITKEYPIPGGERADYAVLVNGLPVAIIEAKKQGMDLNAALAQAKNYTKKLSEMGKEVYLIFASDGRTFYRQNLKANTRPEKISRLMTYAEIKDFLNPETDILLAAKELSKNCRLTGGKRISIRQRQEPISKWLPEQEKHNSGGNNRQALQSRPCSESLIFSR